MKAFSVKKLNQKSIEEKKKNEDKALYNLAVESFLNYDLRSVSHQRERIQPCENKNIFMGGKL